MKRITTIILLLICSVCFSQSKFQVEVDFGFAFQNKKKVTLADVKGIV